MFMKKKQMIIRDEGSSNNEFFTLGTKELFYLYKNNRDLAIRNELIKRHMYITEILAKKYINKGIEYEDIYQVASLGLIYAISR